MKISITQSGGFAGQVVPLASVDLDQVSAADRTRLKQLLDKLDLKHLPEMVESGDVMADALQYEIKIVDGNREHSVNITDDESELATTTRDLIAALQTLPPVAALPKRSGKSRPK